MWGRGIPIKGKKNLSKREQCFLRHKTQNDYYHLFCLFLCNTHFVAKETERPLFVSSL